MSLGMAYDEEEGEQQMELYRSIEHVEVFMPIPGLWKAQESP